MALGAVMEDAHSVVGRRDGRGNGNGYGDGWGDGEGFGW
jgi:hypothetical protein